MKAFVYIALICAVALGASARTTHNVHNNHKKSKAAVFNAGLIGNPTGRELEGDLCAGKVDENIYHPSDCTKFVSCTNERAIEMDCAACDPNRPETCQDGKLVFTLECTPDAPECKPQYGHCIEADRTECGAGQETEEPPTTTTEAPVDPNPQPGDDCDPELCKNIGYCQHYLRCDKETGKLVREECGLELVWNPRGNGSIHGGNCDIWDNLPEDVEEEYRKDEECLACFWRETGECQRNYLYQAPGLKHRNVQTLTCSESLIFSKAKETCQRCQDVNKADGSACC